ncbi:MAG TPA: ABC transporter permease [Acidimicrobiales bacterium]|nr:ABC transporter permease [Acidimicrobiales bacterium]
MGAVVVLVFALPRAMPGDPLAAALDPGNPNLGDPAVRASLQSYYGLDRSLPDQFGHFLGAVAHGDLGVSIERRVPVTSLIRSHLPWTLLLVGTALALSSGLSFLAGVGAAWRQGSARDRALIVTSTTMRAVPSYALASFLVVAFAVVWPVFPLGGAVTPFAVDTSPLARLADVASHLVLPATALTAALFGRQLLLVRNTTVATLGEDYLVLARAKGLPERLLKYRHAGRNALLPFLTLVGLQAGIAVGGAIFIESVFAYPGMGTLVLRAIEARDYPVLEGTFLVLALVVLTANVAVDLLYARLDPRAGRR